MKVEEIYKRPQSPSKDGHGQHDVLCSSWIEHWSKDSVLSLYELNDFAVMDEIGGVTCICARKGVLFPPEKMGTKSVFDV